MQERAVVDIFCGAGGLTQGFVLEGFKVVAGIDADAGCRFAFEHNNRGARFIHKSIDVLTADEVSRLYPAGATRILVGCAPCQPFSIYNRKRPDHDGKWKLLSSFANLICAVDPDIVSMENVPSLVTHKSGMVYRAFMERLIAQGYQISENPQVYCPNYGIPQSRTRLVVFASKFGKVELLPPTHDPGNYRTVKSTIGHLPPLAAGEVSADDPLHRASGLSTLNLRRIRASVPGGSWRDWENELIPTCFTRESGMGYVSVYGRMEWGGLAPTITTECFGYGNGRFGHPDQDRAISLREAALLQTFPPDYAFVEQGRPYHFTSIGKYIGNAVPVHLGRIIARSIDQHLASVGR
jgi:DNA (cytosine-5)-methyltransferase 1